jgi:hypothetical protein
MHARSAGEGTIERFFHWNELSAPVSYVDCDRNASAGVNEPLRNRLRTKP